MRAGPGPLAQAMVKAGNAVIANETGRVKSIRLVTAASSCAAMIGPATEGWARTPFSVREKLESGAVVWKHHPRATYE